MPLITLTTKQWEHETAIEYPFSDIYEAGAPAATQPSGFKKYECGSCGKVFRVSFLCGFPVYWDEKADHEQPTGIEFRWEGKEGLL
jgi:hypothetical protein